MNEPNRVSAPAWMRRWLIAAGVYNLAWGGVMVIAPVWSMRLLGAAPADGSVALWPQLWACIGMIVGVYGVGYLCAARDPMRHWPIVLVGLMGKVLGPIGFLDAAVRGVLPWSMGWTILTNDLLWWGPFAMILWHAARSAHAPPGPDAPVRLEHALSAVRDTDGRSIAELVGDRPALLVLVRHTGCTFCRQTIADLAARQDAVRGAGHAIVVVGVGRDAGALADLGRRSGLRDAAYAADPDRLLYRALELPRGTFAQLFGPRVWVRGVAAFVKGHGLGRLEGDGFQLSGAFLVHRGRVLRAHRHRDAADRSDFAELGACPTT
jgi:hypothetical protein